MKKIILSSSVVILFGIYAFFLKSKNIPGEFLNLDTVPAVTPVLPAVENPSIPVTMAPPPTKPTSTNTKWKNGTFIGDSIDAYYGTVRVSATISSDKITAISFLDYPQDRRTSLQKSNYAIPILKSEAISAQSAEVDTVSGVTYTSEAFIQSLSSALTQAKI